MAKRAVGCAPKLALAIWIMQLSGGTCFAQANHFNTSAEGWTLDGAYTLDSAGNSRLGPIASNFSLIWDDLTNYPGSAGTDPRLNSQGSIRFGSANGPGISDPGATWWIMRFRSPDVSADTAWQHATGYSVQIYHAMGSASLYANLYVVVTDLDQKTTRYFYNGTAQSLSAGGWSSFSFDWSGITTFPTNYVIQGVFVNIWGQMNQSFAGNVYLDEVITETDTVAPTVAIRSPTSSPTYTTNLSTINLVGTASDAAPGRVTIVRWSNDRGGSGTASGTTSWSVNGIVLQSGTNVLTVTAQDTGKNTATATLTVTYTPGNLVPSITSISPSNLPAAGQSFALTVNGTNFVSGSVVRWNNSDRTTLFTSGTQLTAYINAADIAVQGTASVTVFNPAPGGGTSNAATFTITAPVNPVPTITSLNPSSTTAGGPAFTLTVNGSNFISGSLVRWNNANRTTQFISSTQLAASVPASDIAAQGTASITVLNPSPGGGTSNALTFTINSSTQNPVPGITSLNPSSTMAGGAAFTLTVNGTNFISGSVVRWNNSDRTTQFVGSTQVTASIPAGDIASQGTASITVFNPAPGGGASNAATFTITALQNPVPTITSLNPSSATAGGATFTLTVNGSNFVSGSLVRWNSSVRTTQFVSGSQVTATIPAGDIAAQGSASITVVNPSPGGGTSNAVTFTINPSTQNPVPTITSLSPSSATAGGPAFTLTVNGSNFVSGSVVRWNNSDHTTQFAGNTQLTASISAADIAAQGTASITVFNPAPGGGTSNASTFTINAPQQNPVPAVTSLSPSSATAGGSAFTLTVNGSSFISASVVRWNGSDRATQFISSTQLAAAVAAADIASQSTVAITVFNPAPGGGLSNSVTFTIILQCTYSISPTSRSHGAAAESSSVAVTAPLSCAWTASSNTSWLNITSGSSGTGNGTVNYSVAANSALDPRTGTMTIAGQVFTVTQGGTSCSYFITPTSRSHGSGQESGSISIVTSANCAWTAATNTSWVTITGGESGTGSGTVRYAVQANTGPTQRLGSLTVAGNTFTVLQAGGIIPAISSMNPSLVKAGSAGFDLTLNGSNFVVGSVVRWNGQERATTFLGVTQLRASILSSDISSAGFVPVTVVNPGGVASNAKNVEIAPIENPSPSISTLKPVAMMRGAAGFTLTVLGTGFVPASKLRWNGADRTTSYENSTMLTALIPASDVAEIGTASITIFNPAPGGGISRTISFDIWTGTGITDLSPSALPVGGAEIKLTIFGMNFEKPDQAGAAARNRAVSSTLSETASGTLALWNGQPLPTVVISSTELTAQVSSSLTSTAGNAVISVTGSSTGSSNTVPIPITLTKPAPMVTNLSPEAVGPGSNEFRLAVDGKNFFDSSKILWNGATRDTQFVNSTRLQAIIPGNDVAAAGVATVTVSTPGPGGGESNKKTFGFAGTLFYPRLVSTNGTQAEPDDSEYTGIAVANLGGQEAALTFTAFDKSGSVISGTGITNPATVSIKSGQQLPTVDLQLFGSALPSLKPVGWFRMDSTTSGVVGFFLMFNQTLSILDGADVSSATATSFVLPEIEDAGFTQLHVVNPNIEPASVLFELYGPDGALRTAGVTRVLASNSAVADKVVDMFPQTSVRASDYIRMVSDRGIVAFEYFGKTSRYVAGLNGQDADGGSTTLYSPQYVVGGTDWWTGLTVVNLEAKPGKVTMRLINNDGLQIGSTRSLDIGARGKLRITDQSFFVEAGQTRNEGYLQIQSDGIRLAGSVVFGDPARNQFASALPLESNLQKNVVFSQLASDDTYYTGVAMLNPGDAMANVTIDVYDEDGTLVTTKVERINAGRRSIGLLTDYFPQLRGDKRSSGYIRVRSDQGIASFALFGTQRLTALSAVPAQAVP